MSAVIHVLSHTRCQISGLDAKVTALVDEALALEIPGARFQDGVRNGRWDGKRHLFYAATNTFPKGLLARVQALLDEAGVAWTLDDQRTLLKKPDLTRLTPDLLKGITLREYQVKAARKALKAHAGILWLATNAGKCLAPDTPVLRYDGTTVLAGAVVAGDTLLGPDGQPRHVHSTTTGEDALYDVVANRGDNRFTCNAVHVLTIYAGHLDAIVDVPLDVFLTWPRDHQRLARMVFADPITFADPTTPSPVDPWLLGLWYADGRKDLSFVEITKPDAAIEQALRAYATDHGYTLNVQYRGPDQTNPQWRLVTPRGQSNYLLTTLRDVYGAGDRLPARYLRGTLGERRAFLAGIIDGDGSSDGVTVEVTWRHRAWIEGLAFLARSLGFRVHVVAKHVRLPGWEEPRTYWRATLTGDTRQLPLRLERKHAVATQRTGFTVTPVGRGPYAGFTLDGDGRFVLGDFTVTHNTEVASAMMKVLKERRTLFLVHKKTLLTQSRARIALRLGTIEEHIGTIGEGRFDPKHITVATIQSLTRKQAPAKMKIIAAYLKSVELLFIDEGHHAKATTWYKLINRIPAQFRYVLSGTPFGSGNGLMVEAAVGPVVARVSNKTLIKLGVSAVPTIRMVECAHPTLDTDLSWDEVYKHGIVLNTERNARIVQEAATFARAGKPTLILVKELWQGDNLATGFKSLGIKHDFVHGKMPQVVVEKVKARFEAGKIQVLIASPIFDEGVDVPAIQALIVADGGKSVRSVLQKIGRGLRQKAGANVLDVLDFADTTHRWLAAHSQERLAIYHEEGFKVVTAP